MKTAAIVVAVGVLLIAGFQAALALGAPLGRAAWGGRHVRLPTRLRIGSAVAVVVWIVAALVVLARAGVSASPIPAGGARWGTWILLGLLVIGALMNLASSSRWERFGWAPFVVVLAVLTFVVATG